MLENPVAAMLRNMVVEKEDISSGLYDEMSKDVILPAPDVFVYKHHYCCFSRICMHIILFLRYIIVQQLRRINNCVLICRSNNIQYIFTSPFS